MTFTRFLFAGFLVPSLGCGSVAPEPSGPVASPQQACARITAAFEQQATRCGASPWPADVRAAQVKACVEVGSLPGLTFDYARVDQCVAAVPALMCSDYPGPAACDPMSPEGYLRSALALGDPCFESVQCPDKLCVGGQTAGSCGSCMATVGPGAACDATHECAAGFACDSATCVSTGTKPGGKCTTYGGQNDCVAGFYCEPVSPNDGIDGTCSPRPKTGEACDSGVPCAPTDACAGGICATLVHVARGGACDGVARICDDPATCFEGACAAPSEHVGEGQPCNDARDRCLPGLDCVQGGTCAKPATSAGAPCPCGAGLACVDGACLAQKVGMKCYGLAGASCGPELYCKGWGSGGAGSQAGVCALRVEPGASCATATQMELYDVCFAPYFCASSGLCEVTYPACH